jgi:glycerol-3-phosphate O-acyltransferase
LLFSQLIARARENPQIPLLLVPVGILYGAKPRSVERSFWEILFGPRERAGFFIRLFWILFNPGELRVVFLEPIELNRWVAERREPNEELGKKVRLTIRYSLTRIEQTYMGPRLLPRIRMIQRALKDRELRSYLEEQALKRGVNIRDMEIEAYTILDEIAADYRWGVLRFLEFILTRVWSRIYEEINVDHEGIEKIRALKNKGPIVLIPTHKSHMDYLILSYVFKINDLMPPFIAAGINMSFFPAGIFFRRAGAFFIRRTFIGDRLYELCLKAYVRVLLEERYTIEFFIEGTRSRNGQILPPRLGLLGMVLDGSRHLEKAGIPVHIVPVAIDYEFLIEERSIVEEAHGKREKQPESFRSLLGAREKLAHRYGSVYVRFADPIPVQELLSLDSSHPADSLRRAGYRITRELQREVTVTSTAITATTLVTHHRRGISREDFLERYQLFTEAVQYSGGRLASEFLFGSFDPDRALKVFLRNRLIQEISVHGQRIYSILDEGRPTLDYYKNTIVHFLINFAFTATAFRAAPERSFPALWEAYQRLHEIFEEEFHRLYQPPVPEELEGTLRWLEEKGIIRRELDFFAVSFPEQLVSFENVTRSFLESTYIAITTLLENRDRPEPLDLKGWVRLSMEMGLLLYAKGDILRPESRNRVGIENALNTLRHKGILVEVGGEGGDKKRSPSSAYCLSSDRILELEETYQFLKMILEDLALTY